jgi:hypothetical protein
MRLCSVPAIFSDSSRIQTSKGGLYKRFRRARTNVQIGLLIREHIFKVLRRQDPALLLHITTQVIAAWSELIVRQTQFLGKNYSGRLARTRH